MDDYEDYTWMKNDDETNPGFQDFFECISKITEKMDSAKSKVKSAKKKGVELTTDPQTLIDTGFTLTKPEIDLLSLEPDDIRDRYTDVIEFFEAFDEERAAHTSIKTRLSEGMLWGWWRDSYGDTCGLDGVVEFVVQRQGEIDNDIPNYGTRHGYRDETPVVDLELVH